MKKFFQALLMKWGKVSYELNFNILFEDRETQMQNNLYMMEGEAFNSLLEKLNID